MRRESRAPCAVRRCRTATTPRDRRVPCVARTGPAPHAEAPRGGGFRLPRVLRFPFRFPSIQALSSAAQHPPASARFQFLQGELAGCTRRHPPGTARGTRAAPRAAGAPAASPRARERHEGASERFFGNDLPNPYRLERAGRRGFVGCMWSVRGVLCALGGACQPSPATENIQSAWTSPLRGWGVGGAVFGSTRHRLPRTACTIGAMSGTDAEVGRGDSRGDDPVCARERIGVTKAQPNNKYKKGGTRRRGGSPGAFIVVHKRAPHPISESKRVESNAFGMAR